MQERLQPKENTMKLNAVVEKQEQRGNDLFLHLLVGVAGADVPLEVTLHGVKEVHSINGEIGVVMQRGVPVVMGFSLPMPS